jgi:large repetitive protein
MKKNHFLRFFSIVKKAGLMIIILGLIVFQSFANEDGKNLVKDASTTKLLPPPVPTISVTSGCFTTSLAATGCIAPYNSVEWQKDGYFYTFGATATAYYLSPLPAFFKARCFDAATNTFGDFSPETKYITNTYAEVITHSPTICAGGTVTLNASSASSTLAYQWYRNGTSIPSATSSSYIATTTGDYRVYTSTMPSSGCQSYFSKALTIVSGLPPAPTIAWNSAPSGYCNSTLTATGCPPPAINVRWYRNDGVAGWTNLGTLGNPIFLPTTFTPPEYRATCIVGGCESLPSNVMVGTPNNFTEITPTNPTFCSTGSVTLVANSVVSGLNYQWKLGSTNISGATSPSYTTSTTGNYTVVATSLANGCSFTSKAVTTDILYPPSPYILATTSFSPATINEGESLTLLALGCTGLSTILWSTGETASSIVVSPSTNTNYTFTCTHLPCTGVVSGAFVVNVIPLAVPLLLSTSLSTCSGTSVTLTGSCAKGAFLWTITPVNQNAVIVVSPSITTTYTASCTNGLATSTNSITISVFNGTITSLSSGLWNNPATWSCNCIPAPCNDVIVNTGHLVSIQPANQGSTIGKLKNLTLRGTVEIKNNSMMKLN